jgi:hypothetical protein
VKLNVHETGGLRGTDVGQEKYVRWLQSYYDHILTVAKKKIDVRVLPF